MDAVTSSLESAIAAISSLTRVLKKNKARQVTSQEECAQIKATSYAWIKVQREELGKHLLDLSVLEDIDKSYALLLEHSDHGTLRSKYLETLRILKSNLIALRSHLVSSRSAEVFQPTSHVPPPDFSKLISDSKMQEILIRRWEETQKCLDSEAFLAATVMMGALLEALLLARVNSMGDLRPIFKLKSTPIDSTTGKKKELKKWMLNDYTQVALELKWIRPSSGRVGEILRDYRNFIHPARELTTGIIIQKSDADMFWAIFQQLSLQILASV